MMIMSAQIAYGSQDKFVIDVKHTFGVTKSILISNNCDSFSEISISLPNSFICYSDGREDQELVWHIQWLKKLGQLELIFFLEGDHNTLLHMLDSDTNIFHSSVTIILSGYPTTKLNLRLDSRLFYYQGHQNDKLTLVELYAIKGGPLIEREIGKWTSHHGLVVPNPNIWDRRANLMGTKLKCTTMPGSILTIVKHDSTGNVANITGLFQDIIHHLEDSLNFTAQTKVSKDGKWGSYEKDTSSWNGMVGMLINNEADIATAALTQTLERSEAIFFTIPLQHDMSTLIAPLAKGKATQFWVYMDIFSITIWVAISTIMLSICVGFFLINVSGVNSFHKSVDSEEFGIDNSLALSIIMLFQLSYDVVVEKMSAKVLYFFAGITTYILFAYYTSDLTARMTSGPPSTAIRSFQDVLEKKYKVIVLHSSSNHELLKTSNPNSAMYKVYWTKITGNSDSIVNSDDEALGKVLTEAKTLLFSDGVLVFGDTRYVALNMIDSIKISMSWGLQNNSELADFFNHYLINMQQNGVMNRINRNWKYQATEDFSFEDAISLGYENTLFPFLLLLLGFCFAICLVPIEKYVQVARYVNR
jgi:ABC-type amino acid transport substrate-binding protein